MTLGRMKSEVIIAVPLNATAFLPLTWATVGLRSISASDMNEPLIEPEFLSEATLAPSLRSSVETLTTGAAPLTSLPAASPAMSASLSALS